MLGMFGFFVPLQGASYEYIDGNAQNRKTYYHKLEDIALNGTSTMHGPVSLWEGDL